jgi:hypothetical protein
MRHAAPGLLVLATMLAAAACSAAARTIHIGAYSQLDSPSRASAGGAVHVGYRDPGSSGVSVSSPIAPSSSATPGSSAPSTSNVESSDIDSAGFRDRGGAVPCAAPAIPGTCFRVPAPPGARGPRGGRGAPPADPRVLAQLAVDRLAMLPGSIRVSPSRQVKGLTGAPSWFWLDPAPTTESVTVSQGAESVTVTATPERVGWNFGDGDEVDGGPGRPYGESADRRGAMRHRYRTRCLPGDQGRDPYVLASCTDDGYQVQAGVEWSISFQAVGPITTAGGLSPQTTTATIAYPVTEVRGILAREGGAR